MKFRNSFGRSYPPKSKTGSDKPVGNNPPTSVVSLELSLSERSISVKSYFVGRSPVVVISNVDSNKADHGKTQAKEDACVECACRKVGFVELAVHPFKVDANLPQALF